MVFFLTSFIVFSRVSFDEEMTISGHVTTARVPYAGHLGFVCYGHDVIESKLSALLLVALMVSPVRVVPVVLI
jgi:hypothetical protein